MRPVVMDSSAMPMAIAVAVWKLRPSAKPVSAGITIIAETSSTPTIRIATTVVSAVRMVSKQVERTDRHAAGPGEVLVERDGEQLLVEPPIATVTTAPSATMSQTSPLVTVRMLPKRIAKRSALKPRARLMSTTASAKPPERNTARAASPCSAPRARSRSMPTAPARATTSAPSTGEIAEHEAQRHSGERHVGQGVGDQREPARDQEDADGRADERGDHARRERPMHEAVLEELGHGLSGRG